MREMGRGQAISTKTFTEKGSVCRVSGVSNTASKSKTKPPLDQPVSGAGCHSEKDLQDAIKQSQDYLFSIQHEEGYWVGELMVDSTLVSDMIAYHHWADDVDPEWQRKAVNHVFSMQLEDGGWNIYTNGPAEVNATVKAYLALKLAGVAVTDPRMLKAREMACHLGGPVRMNTFSKLYLALLGLYPWGYLPTIPPEMMYIGKWFYVNFWEMSNWTRSMLVPLAIINAHRPTRIPRDGICIDELYPEGFHKRDLMMPRDPETFTFRNFFFWLDKLHKLAEWFAQNDIHPFRKAALKKNEEWMLERLEGTDGLAAIYPAMLNCLISLKAMGYNDDHPQVKRAELELKRLEHETLDTVRIEPCLSPVWDTAIVSMCLSESGVPQDDPRMEKCTTWLLDREIRFRGDWIHKNPVDVEPSGWVFEFNNKWNPDVDDSAMVIMALRHVPTKDKRRRDECVARAVEWMLTFQCRDGGWAAFDKDCTKNIMNKVPFADHNAMLDPECADITARILECLGRVGFDVDHPQIQRGIKYVKAQQEHDGSWYGRWGVNYIYGTWQVLRGMESLGWDMSESWLQQGGRWLESVQLEDGGWGERCNTYDDPVYKGKGPSTASQTAWAVMGLCSLGDPDRESLRRGINYLIREQNLEGSWNELETTGTGFPKVFYLKYDMYRNAWPLLALGDYKNLLATKATSAKKTKARTVRKKNVEPAVAA
jgi:squalene-hopene/tetraprenyl-beta-curcumene cyclase